MEETASADDTDGLRFSPADVLERARTLGDVFRPLLDLKQVLPRA